MLFSDDFVFVHFPKAAGKSLTKYLIRAWEGPIYAIVSPGQVKELVDVVRVGLTLEIGRGHENLAYARRALAERGRDIGKCRAIIACMRNPYDIAVSTYHFMRKMYPHNRNPRFKHAATLDFEAFWCTRPPTAPPERWFTVEGNVLANQRYLRFECLADDIKRLAEEFSFKQAALPHLNASSRGDYRDYMTARAEEAVYRHFKFLFDAGYYAREEFSEVPAIQTVVTGGAGSDSIQGPCLVPQ